VVFYNVQKEIDGKTEMEKEKLKTFDSNQKILRGFHSPMDAEAILYHFTATIFAGWI